MRIQEYKRARWTAQAMRFLLLTCVSAGISLGLPIGLREFLGVPPEIGVAVGFVTAFIVNFAVLRSVVFSSRQGVLGDLVLFGLSTLSFRAVEYVGFLLLYRGVGFNYAIALVVVLSISSAAKFVWYRSRWGVSTR